MWWWKNKQSVIYIFISHDITYKGCMEGSDLKVSHPIEDEGEGMKK